MKGFLVAGGSVPGTDHIKPGQPGWTNNQDAFAWHADEDLLIAVTCDGCGSTPYPEVGSRLGSRMAIKRIVAHMRAGLWTRKDRSLALDALADDMEYYLRQICRMLADQEFEAQVANDHFLFTLMVAIMTKDETHVLSFGDGVFALNGEVFGIAPVGINSPPYLGQKLVPGAMAEKFLHFTMQRTMPTKDVHSLLIGSDGVKDLIAVSDKLLPGTKEPLGPISQFWTDDLFVRNPDAIRRRLAMANKSTVDYSIDGEGRLTDVPRIKKGLLRDDTTLVLIKRERTQDA